MKKYLDEFAVVPRMARGPKKLISTYGGPLYQYVRGGKVWTRMADQTDVFVREARSSESEGGLVCWFNQMTGGAVVADPSAPPIFSATYRGDASGWFYAAATKSSPAT